MTSARPLVSELQHPDSRSFEDVAAIYERARPSYPEEAVAWIRDVLDLCSGRTVLDLGAGTGKLTRQLLETGATVIAVEPGDAMRAQLGQAVPDVEALRGSAEEIPLRDDSVDAITVGQAFHWFRHEEALPEMHRVLRPGGGVALLWNARDPESPLVQEVNDVLEEVLRDREPTPDSSLKLVESSLFGPVEEKVFQFAQELDADGLAERVASISFVAAMPPDRREDIESRIRAVVNAAGGLVTFPYVTNVYVSFAA
jgi:ubiquinone/menaquinone biosynthesis C-methylase UbiE